MGDDPAISRCLGANVPEEVKQSLAEAQKRL